jgi:hypothetical protein
MAEAKTLMTIDEYDKVAAAVSLGDAGEPFAWGGLGPGYGHFGAWVRKQVWNGVVVLEALPEEDRKLLTTWLQQGVAHLLVGHSITLSVVELWSEIADLKIEAGAPLLLLLPEFEADEQDKTLISFDRMNDFPDRPYDNKKYLVWVRYFCAKSALNIARLEGASVPEGIGQAERRLLKDLIDQARALFVLDLVGVRDALHPERRALADAVVRLDLQEGKVDRFYLLAIAHGPGTTWLAYNWEGCVAPPLDESAQDPSTMPPDYLDEVAQLNHLSPDDRKLFWKWFGPVERRA